MEINVKIESRRWNMVEVENVCIMETGIPTTHFLDE
jgi:hypothetical protein